MENTLAIIGSFAKNLGTLYVTVFMVFFASAIIKNKGLAGFSFSFWIHDNKSRFSAGAIFIFGLSFLMAITDAAPLFHWIGLDINASPVALGLGIAVLLGLAPTKARTLTKKGVKAKQIAVKADEIIKKSAEIQQDEKKGE
jgi:hypothetical protein